MHQRHDHQPAQHRDQETDRQIHDRFDHWVLRTIQKSLTNNAMERAQKASPLPR
jgi:hypothetical protein